MFNDTSLRNIMQLILVYFRKINLLLTMSPAILYLVTTKSSAIVFSFSSWGCLSAMSAKLDRNKQWLKKNNSEESCFGYSALALTELVTWPKKPAKKLPCIWRQYKKLRLVLHKICSTLSLSSLSGWWNAWKLTQINGSLFSHYIRCIKRQKH